ncbi:MAG: tetratricopeptide repeat protein [Phycisphaerales bacterium]|nr:tetratricopeptide repeat protein [Phycisphaerales bacterium]
MAIFKRKSGKEGDQADSQPNGAELDIPESADAALQPDPRKAKAFFERAQTVHETTNYEYAMTMWLSGLLRDWSNFEAMEKFFASTAAFLRDNPKAKGPTKDQSMVVRDAKGPATKFVSAILEWGTKPSDWADGLRAAEEAIKLGQSEQAIWLGDRVLGKALDDKKAKKAQMVKLMEVLRQAGAFELAVRAGEFACRLDPSDARLQAEVRNLSAEETMSKGGYDQTGQAGGFRKNIRDLDEQRRLDEADRIVKSEETVDRVVNEAAADYQQRPNDLAAIQKYAKILLERDKPGDLKLAHNILMRGFNETANYRLKQQAGEIRLRAGRRKIAELRTRLAGEPDNAELASLIDSATNELAQAEIAEYRERVANYPTDLALKFELGRRLFDAGEYEAAIQQLQEGQNAPGKLVDALLYLAHSFEKLGWNEEAEQTYRRALADEGNLTQELLLASRYGLMSSLEARGRENRDLDAAEEALKLASSIAIQQIGYRDVRDRRTELQALVKELRG